MKKLVISMFLAGLVLCCPTIIGLAAAAEPSPKIGFAAPTLELPSVNGGVVSLRKSVGEKVILTFFTSWSKACQDELKNLQSIYGTSKTPLDVLAVSFDKKTKDLNAFLAKTNPPFPVLHDKKLSSIDTYQILILPTTFCINRDGVIEKVFVDYDDNVKKALEEWLKS